MIEGNFYLYSSNYSSHLLSFYKKKFLNYPLSFSFDTPVPIFFPPFYTASVSSPLQQRFPSPVFFPSPFGHHPLPSSQHRFPSSRLLFLSQHNFPARALPSPSVLRHRLSPGAPSAPQHHFPVRALPAPSGSLAPALSRRRFGSSAPALSRRRFGSSAPVLSGPRALSLSAPFDQIGPNGGPLFGPIWSKEWPSFGYVWPNGGSWPNKGPSFGYIWPNEGSLFGQTRSNRSLRFDPF